MDSDPANRRRALLQTLLWIVGTLLVLMGALASWRMVAARELAVERERTRLQGEVEDTVEQWEDALLNQLQTRLEVAASNPKKIAVLQARLRKEAWFDSVFLWIPPGPGNEPMPYFPEVSVPDETEQLKRSPCLNQALHFTISDAASIDRLVQAWLLGCRHENENVRLWASVMASYMLMNAGRPDDALMALEAANIPENLMTLRAGASRGVSPFRLTSWHTLRIQLLLKTGRPEIAAAFATRLGEQLSELEAPDLAAVGLHMPDVLETLRRTGHDTEARALEQRFQRADRRKRAYDEVQRKLIIEQIDPNHPPPPRFVYDIYSDKPFLLYYGWSDGYGVGIALEQDPLIEDFLRNKVRIHGLQGAVTVVEQRSGSWVAGARSGGKCSFMVPFNHTLRHLQLCVRESAVTAATSNVNEQMLVPMLAIMLGVGFGLGALWAIGRATSHEYELIDRQRAFSTRVTHELKTPLAGIRVMAENLELGAFRDEQHRKEMAHRIVVEADQLKRRLDEVLSVARERTIPSPEPFDPEEVLYLAIEEWGPRFGDAGVDFQAELAPTDTVMGDATALKDAVVCLLDNALKYRRDDREPKVRLELVELGKQVQISVTDNGLGVPKAMRRKIFDRFVRVEGPGRGKAGGHGLGLHQVREIVTAHHGTVTCNEGIDGGAQFVIRLPVHRPSRKA
jgi:signal transduction histidine kinase